jgi:hypothetical protein
MKEVQTLDFQDCDITTTSHLLVMIQDSPVSSVTGYRLDDWSLFLGWVPCPDQFWSNEFCPLSIRVSFPGGEAAGE